jgi:hypothetical protein
VRLGIRAVPAPGPGVGGFWPPAGFLEGYAKGGAADLAQSDGVAPLAKHREIVGGPNLRISA